MEIKGSQIIGVYVHIKEVSLLLINHKYLLKLLDQINTCNPTNYCYN